MRSPTNLLGWRPSPEHGWLKPIYMQLGTFSIIAVDDLNVEGFVPIIDPPNAGILGVARLRYELSLLNGAIAHRLPPSVTRDYAFPRSFLRPGPVSQWSPTWHRPSRSSEPSVRSNAYF